MTPTALSNALESNTRQAEQQLREAERALYAESEQQTRLEHLISSKLADIASLQLRIDPMRDLQTRQLFEQRERTHAALTQELEDVEGLIARRLEALQAVRSNLDRLDSQSQDLLEQDPAVRQLSEQLDEALQAEQQAHASYDEIRDECASKLQGYNSNPLYRFLKANHYGTEQYRPRLFQRAFDNYLARRVGFRVNYANEQILLTMQARNETLRQALGEAREQLQAQHHQQLDKARETFGMPALRVEEQGLSTLVSEGKAQARSLQAQLADFAQKRDPYLQQIRQDIADQLQARPLAELIVEAAKTPSPHDDVLVNDLQLLHARLREIQQRLHGLQDQALDKRRLYDRAKALEYALRNDHFSDPCHEYQLSPPIEQVLADYMSGLLDQQAVEKRLDDGREYVAPRHRGNKPHSTGRSSGGSSSDGFRTSGSSGGGGFSSSRSSGGGGFRTTGSF